MAIFNVTDLDGDGTILKSEFETTYREAEGVDKVYKEDFQIIDSDKNEKISRLELMVCLNSNSIALTYMPDRLFSNHLPVNVVQMMQKQFKRRCNI